MPNYDHQTITSHILNPPCMYSTSDAECGTECGTECFTHAPTSHTAGSCGSNILTFISVPPEGPGGMVTLTESGWYNIHQSLHMLILQLDTIVHVNLIYR